MLSQMEDKSLKRFKKIIKDKLGDKFLDLKLFGSKARGSDKYDSDVDVIVIVSSDDWHLCDIVYNISTDLMLDTNVCISPKIISLRKFRDLQVQGSSFIQNILRDPSLL